MKIKVNTLTTDMFLELYTSVGWEPPCREQVECALKNTADEAETYGYGSSQCSQFIFGAA